MPEIESLRQKPLLRPMGLGRLTGVTSGAGLSREVVETMARPQMGLETAWKAARVERFLQLVELRPLPASLGKTMGEWYAAPTIRPGPDEAPVTRPPHAARQSIEDILAHLAAEVPEEEWRRLPEDLADNLDHYVYGTPKR